MHATVLTFDDDRTGSVVFDDGHVEQFDAAAFRRGGLRLLRPGQRVRLRRDASGRIEAITIATLPEPP